MEDSHTADSNTDEILMETNENSVDTNQKGVKKRVAQTPPENDAKKPKLSRESSHHSVVDLSDESPQKDEQQSPKTPRTPKTPKVSKEDREKLKREKLEEKEKQKAERERLLDEKRIEKEKLAEEKRLEKEKKEKERLEKKAEDERKKEEKRKEAEEKKKKEEEEKMKKDEEKQKKEEEKQKKEEEKNRKKKEDEEKKEAKRKEEEEKKEAKRREEEAAEEKKRRESAHFVKFFNKVEKKKAPEPQKAISSWYLPFEPKDGMSMAPILARKPLPADFDLFQQSDEITSLFTFLECATKRGNEKPSKDKKKLFQFHENRRPAYYGTWRKKLKSVTGSCPLTEEEGIDYEVDSADEWEEEPSDCEECNSDDDDNDNDDEDGDDNDGFFVPPCYLSDGEGEDETSEGESDEKKDRKPKRVTIASDDEGDSNDAHKARMAQRAVNWKEGTEKKKEVVLKPRAVGPVFHNGADQPPDFKFMPVVKFY